MACMVQEIGNLRPVCPSRRRWMKYEGAVRRFCIEQGIRAWCELAQERDTWEEYATEFVKCGDNEARLAKVLRNV